MTKTNEPRFTVTYSFLELEADQRPNTTFDYCPLDSKLIVNVGKIIHYLDLITLLYFLSEGSEDFTLRDASGMLKKTCQGLNYKDEIKEVEVRVFSTKS